MIARAGLFHLERGERVAARSQRIRRSAHSRTSSSHDARRRVAHRPSALQFHGLWTLAHRIRVAILLAFLISQIVCERELARRGHDTRPRAVSDVLFAALFGTLIGAKVYYILIVTHDISDLWTRGGFVFWGGFLGAVALLRDHHPLQEAAVRSLRGRRRDRDRGRLCRGTHRLLGRGRRLRQAVQRAAGGDASRMARRRRRCLEMQQVFHQPFPPGTRSEHGGLRRVRRS